MAAMTEPAPIKKLCMAKPMVRCSEGNLSPTNARNGSMLTLMDASRIQSIPPATQSAGELGITSKAKDARMAPMKKYGRRRPQ